MKLFGISKLDIEVPHQLTQEEALKRTRNFLDDLKKQYVDKISHVREEWEENNCKFSFSVMGISTSGTLAVKPSDIEISGDLPIIIRGPIKKKIESTIRERAEKLLA